MPNDKNVITFLKKWQNDIAISVFTSTLTTGKSIDQLALHPFFDKGL